MNNHISKIKRESGETLEDWEDIEHELTGYFQDLLTELVIARSNVIEKVTQHIPIIVIAEQNIALMQIISLQEVEIVVNQMSKDTALGSNGFMVKFFHNCWNILKHEVLEVVEEAR